MKNKLSVRKINGDYFDFPYHKKIDGLYILNTDDNCKTGCYEIDSHLFGDNSFRKLLLLQDFIVHLTYSVYHKTITVDNKKEKIIIKGGGATLYGKDTDHYLINSMNLLDRGIHDKLIKHYKTKFNIIVDKQKHSKFNEK